MMATQEFKSVSNLPAKEWTECMDAEFAPLFELSCAERLQLVEDLWDSIAKEADQIPVPDWQIEEVERIRIKAEQNPASLESWDSVREWIGKNMGNRIAITPEAKHKLSEAFQWYESKQVGLGHEFLRAFSACFGLVQRHPEISPVVKGYRKGLPRKLPLHVLL